MMILVVPTLNSLVFRLRDSAVQHMNERILECEANVGEEEVKLQLLTPPGKDLDTVLDQLSALQVCFVIKNLRYKIEEINTKYYFKVQGNFSTSIFVNRKARKPSIPTKLSLKRCKLT